MIQKKVSRFFFPKLSNSRFFQDSSFFCNPELCNISGCSYLTKKNIISSILPNFLNTLSKKITLKQEIQLHLTLFNTWFNTLVTKNINMQQLTHCLHLNFFYLIAGICSLACIQLRVYYGKMLQLRGLPKNHLKLH